MAVGSFAPLGVGNDGRSPRFSVAGMAGAAAGAGTIVSTFLIGVVADRFSFKPILITASMVPLLAAGLVLILVRNDARSGRGVVKVI